MSIQMKKLCNRIYDARQGGSSAIILDTNYDGDVDECMYCLTEAGFVNRNKIVEVLQACVTEEADNKTYYRDDLYLPERMGAIPLMALI